MERVEFPNSSTRSGVDASAWHLRVGLLPVPLRAGDSGSSGLQVLLNGSRGNLCLQTVESEEQASPREVAWSSDVGHFVRVKHDEVEVYDWDTYDAGPRRYSRRQVADNLEKFHKHLASDYPDSRKSVVAHIIRQFRSLWALLPDGASGHDGLKAFLRLLADAAVAQNVPFAELESALPPQANEVKHAIGSNDWDALRENLLASHAFGGLVPDLSLVLRHASGQVFQEAHYAAAYGLQSRLRFPGVLPPPLDVRRGGGAGSYFTPVHIARALVEAALDALEGLEQRPSLTVFDPACGSGEFLREALRQLQLRGYEGGIRLVGWDISEPACDLARFILEWERQFQPQGVHVEIVSTDSLAAHDQWPTDVDLLLMNPPFVSNLQLAPEVRGQLKNVLGTTAGPRPDLAHAFIKVAAERVAARGVIGAVIPGSFLDSDSASLLRNYVGEVLSTRLIGRLGSQHLFSDAVVDAGYLVAEGRGSRSGDPSLAVWADYRPDSSSDAFRALRRWRASGKSEPLPLVRKNFSIYRDEHIGHGAGSWATMPYESRQRLAATSGLPRVADLFNVRQGARTGENNAFVLERAQVSRLPPNEREFFRPAVINQAIRSGFLSDDWYVFYPYGDAKIENEEHLLQAVPHYANAYLLPAKQKLTKRRLAATSKWWELSRQRIWQIEPEPKIVSKYFGGVGAFAWDDDGSFVVIQGMAWVPKSQLKVSWSRSIALAYIAILNSPAFAELLGAVSKTVAGGQWNLSTKYVSDIRVPDLTRPTFPFELLQGLTEIGDRFRIGMPPEVDALRELTEAAYEVRA